MERGTIISFEGGDGSGKGTQSRMLFEHMQARHIPVRFESFPRYHTPTGEKIAAYLNGELGDTVNARIADELFSNDRLAAKDEIIDWREQGGSWVFDRYIDSNKGHQGGKLKTHTERADYFDENDYIEFTVNGMPVPDKTILLTVPPMLAQAHVDRKIARSYTDKKRDIHEADPHHLQNANDSFHLFATLNPTRVIELNPVAPSGLEMLPQEIIHNKVVAALQPLLDQLIRR